MYIGTPDGPPNSTAPIGPSRKVSTLSFSGAAAAVNFLSGTMAVVIVLPSLMSRTGPASRSSLFGRTNVSFSGTRLLLGLAADGHRHDELALIGIAAERLVRLGDFSEQRLGLGVGRLGRGLDRRRLGVLRQDRARNQRQADRRRQSREAGRACGKSEPYFVLQSG